MFLKGRDTVFSACRETRINQGGIEVDRDVNVSTGVSSTFYGIEPFLTDNLRCRIVVSLFQQFLGASVAAVGRCSHRRFGTG